MAHHDPHTIFIHGSVLLWYTVPLGSLGAPCIYGSQCTTVNAQCAAGFCRCLPGYFYKQRVCGEMLIDRLAAFLFQTRLIVRPSVCLFVCDVGELCSRCTTKVATGT